MQNDSLQKYQFLARAIVFVGVFAGLLFSCGEGIRLFPFPTEIARNTTFKWQIAEGINYQKNVHRFENKQENHTKVRRDNPHQYWTDVNNPQNYSLFAGSAVLLVANFSFSFRSAESIIIADSHGSRAPPIS